MTIDCSDHLTLVRYCPGTTFIVQLLGCKEFRDGNAYVAQVSHYVKLLSPTLELCFHSLNNKINVL